MSTLDKVLAATGYTVDGSPAPGLALAQNSHDRQRHAQAFNPRGLNPDAVWTQGTDIAVFFKHVESEPSAQELGRLCQIGWNLGMAPLLWLVSPTAVRVYNCYSRPAGDYDHTRHLLRTFSLLDDELRRLDEYAGRLALETGKFWTSEKRIDRRQRVDRELLEDLRALEVVLSATLALPYSHALIGRSIFIQYLIDREILPKNFLISEFGGESLALILRDHAKTYALFQWVKDVFNGNMFPPDDVEQRSVSSDHLNAIAELLDGKNPMTGQGSLWPYKFDVIPIELISSIYEQFAHSASGDAATRQGLHYTPVNLVNLILDEVLDGLSPKSTVADITCGSGVFLVETLRRLVRAKAGDSPPTRKLIHDTLQKQIFGVDSNETAVRIAAFSLYLAVLELDPNPSPPKALRFPPLIGTNLFVGDAFDFDSTPEGRKLQGREFDAIVGNPPWTYGGQAQKASRKARERSGTQVARSPDQDFVWRAMDFSHDKTRLGIVLKATPFFSRTDTSIAARQELLKALAPVTLVDLSALRGERLFPTATAPAMVLLARCRPAPSDQMTVVHVPWSPTFKRLGSFELSPEMIQPVGLGRLDDHPELLKLAARGTPRDLALYERLIKIHTSVREQLLQMRTGLEDGFQVEGGADLDASALLGLPMLESGELQRFSIDTVALPRFTRDLLHRPRSRDIYRAPLVIVSESVPQGRALSAFTSSDVAYSESFFGAAFPKECADAAIILTGVLNSAVLSWFVVMTGAEFAVHKRRIFKSDIEALPIPSLTSRTSESDRLIEFVCSARGQHDQDLEALDALVFDLYGLEAPERSIIKDGLAIAQAEFVQGRQRLQSPASEQQLTCYANVLCDVVNAWLRGRRTLRSEIIKPLGADLRVVRFFVGDRSTALAGETERLDSVLRSISQQLRFDLGPYMHTRRVLRVYGENDFFIIKPGASRYWTATAALNDGDAVVAENFGRALRRPA